MGSLFDSRIERTPSRFIHASTAHPCRDLLQAEASRRGRNACDNVGPWRGSPGALRRDHTGPRAAPIGGTPPPRPGLTPAQQMHPGMTLWGLHMRLSVPGKSQSRCHMPASTWRQVLLPALGLEQQPYHCRFLLLLLLSHLV